MSLRMSLRVSLRTSLRTLPGLAGRSKAAWLLALCLLPGLAAARCLPFKLKDALNRVPLVVLGKVTQSNQDSLVTASCQAQACSHRFNIDVVEVLKGKTSLPTLQVQYDYRAQRPEISLFANGQDFIFLVSRIGPNGQATLLGTSCDRPGLPAQQLDQVRPLLKKP